jgi:hypothetical protein
VPAIAFDRGDAIWLRGYSNALLALTEFLLAHDWREGFEATFHIFFPRPEWPFAQLVNPPGGAPFDSDRIADVVSFIHLLNWPVVEPARLGATRRHLGQVIALSRQSWDAIEAETDDDREWIPSPRQTSQIVRLTVDRERLAAWRAMLDEAEAVLDGRKLVPHWRFAKGFNLRRVFEEPRRFDLVLWITGPGAVPFLEDGPVTTGETWGAIADAFQGGFGSYLVWWN